MSLRPAKTSTGHFRVARTHPNFFWLLLVFNTCSLVIGLTMVLTEQHYALPYWQITKSIIPLRYWGLLGVTAAVTSLYGLTMNRLSAIRVGTAVAAFFYASVGLSLLFTFFLDHSTAPSGPATWLAIAILHMLASMEPFTNPATRSD